MVVALDIGGTHLRIAGLDIFSSDSPTLLWHETFDSPQSPDGAVTLISNTLSQKDLTGVEGIGISLAGVINVSAQALVRLPNLAQWNGFDLAGELSSKFPNIPIRIMNDAAAAAIGESFYGAGKDHDFIFVIWGTGIGGAEVRNVNDQKVILCFEPGHQIIEQGGLSDSCGQTGCLEAYAGGKTKHTEDALDALVEYMAQGMATMVAIRPTQLLVFGGGVTIHHPMIIKILEENLRNRLRIVQSPKCMISTLGDDAGLFGAAASIVHSVQIL